MHATIKQLVQGITPHDDLEQAHIDDILAWIDSGAPLFRVAKPDTPPKHLVVYFVVFDQENQSLLLVDHKLSGKWLPTGGHVEVNEHPSDAALREAMEELGLAMAFHDITVKKPFFLSYRDVVNVDGTGAHTDVSLWYILRGNISDSFTHDESEFTTISWHTFDEILKMDKEITDPYMHRFVDKLKQALL